MSVAGGEQYLWSQAGVGLRENLFIWGFSGDRRGPSRKGLGEVRWSLWDPKELMFQQSIRTCHDGCQIFQNHGLCMFLFKVRLLCAAVGALWSTSRHLTPLSRTLFILLHFQRHLSKLPSTHLGWISHWIKNIPTEVWRNACGWDCTKLGSSYPELLNNLAVVS